MIKSYQIITKSLDRHNDYITLYLTRNADGQECITDDRNTIEDFELSGYPSNRGRCKSIRRAISRYLYDKRCVDGKDYYMSYYESGEITAHIPTKYVVSYLEAIEDMEHLIVYLNKLFERGQRRMVRKHDDLMAYRDAHMDGSFKGTPQEWGQQKEKRNK